ncbi:carbonic anhydrase [Streptomyces sp. WAC07061]|uniref:carbonic anhydrase n=1 Tax=Streptomyces sp. WAC07061 TaxID=2487410 RepID=UPI0021AF2D99|nr:carbonic anhydrase [Streptomyces sp. WAC07061]
MDSTGPPRRRALLAGGLAALAGALSACTAAGSPRGAGTGARPEAAAPNATPATPVTPDAAFARLMEGNRRWVEGSLQHPDRDPTRRELVAQSQMPFGVVLSCIDSRVAPELVFDTGLGDLYVLRTGGQAVGPVVTGSVEYGPVTGGTPLVFVLGHQRCGAIEAAYKALRDGKDLPGNLRAVQQALKPAYVQVAKEGGTGDPVDRMIRAQIKLTADDLRANAALAPLVRKGSLVVVGGYYSLDTGEVEVLTGAPSGAATPSPAGTGAATPGPSAHPEPSGTPAPRGTVPMGTMPVGTPS